MANDDRALVIGIRSYPGFDNPNDPSRQPLVSPEADATAFYNWLIDPTGGAVLQNKVTLIVTSKWKTPFSTVRRAKPTHEQIKEAIEDLQDEAGHEDDGHLGRRFYMYMAGHGIAPNENETALLMANANYAKGRYGTSYHVIGEYIANCIAEAGWFDEILLFMDCCREIQAVPAPDRPWGPQRDPNAVDNVKRFYVMGAKFQRVSWEAPMANGEIHGVFSQALLAGLRGAASDPQTNQITTDSLWNYLVANMKGFMPPSLQNDPNVPKVPDRGRADSFVIVAGRPISKYPVTIHLPPNSAGKQVALTAYVDGGVEQIDSTSAAPPIWQLNLGVGGYKVQIPEDNVQCLFEVTGTGGIDVHL